MKIKNKLIEIQDWLKKEIDEMGGMHIFLLTCVVALVAFPFLILYFLLLQPTYKFFQMLMEAKELGLKTSHRKYFHSEEYKDELYKKNREKEKEMLEKYPQGMLKQFRDWEDWPEAYVEDGIAVYGAEGRTLLYVDESVEEFDVPDGVVNIYHRCFARCNKLRSVTLPQTLKRIGKRAFYECVSLREIVIPESVYIIEEETFLDCSSLEQVVLPSQISNIPYRMFCNCKRLYTIELPVEVKVIEKEAFRQCHSLEQIKPNEQLEIIRENAFENCYSLKEFVMPDSVRFFCQGVFNGCHSLEHLHFSSQIRDFGGSCCRECWSLNQITMTPLMEEEKDYYREKWEEYADEVDISTSECPVPDSKFWSMDDCLYFGVPRLTSVCLVLCFSKKEEYTIPSFVTNIKQEAFSSCKNLRSLRLSPYIKASCDPWEHNNVSYSFIYDHWPQVETIVFDEALKNTNYAFGIIG